MSILRRSVTVLLVAAMLAVAFGGFASAAIQDVTGTRFEDAVKYLNGLGVVEGRPDGFYPNEPITRAEAAKIIVYIIGKADLANLVKGSMPFKDVPGTHWASGYILIAKNLNIINGYPDGTFKPENNVTYAEFAKLLVAAAGLPPAPGQTWPLNYIMPAQTAGILDNVPGFAAGVAAIRGDCAIMGAKTVRDVRNPSTGLTLAQSVFGQSLVTTIEVTPGTVSVGVGIPVEFSFVAKDQDGDVVTDATATWSTTTPTKAVITSTGRFTATAAGIYTVTAKIGTAVGTATVNVFGVPTALKATVDKPTLVANGVSKATITVEVIDANGVRVPTATNEITIKHYDNDGAVTLPAVEDRTVAAVNGLATFVVTATNLSGETDGLEFTAVGLTRARLSVSTVAQVARSIGLTASPTQIMSNPPTTSLVTASILDQDGQPMLAGVFTVTFTISGSCTFDSPYASQSSVNLGTVDQKASISVIAKDGVTGNATVTAAVTGLSSRSVSISAYVAGVPKSIRVTSTDTVGATGDHDVDMEVTIWLADANGRLAKADSPVYVELIPPADSGLLRDNGQPLETLVLTFTGTDTSQKVSFRGTKSGSFRVTVRDVDTDNPAVSSTSFNCTVSATYVGGARITPNGDPQIWLPFSNPKVTFTVQLTDGADGTGNLVRKAGVQLRFRAYEGTTVRGSWSATNGIVITDAGGTATITFTAPTSVNRYYTIKCEVDRDGDGTYDFTDQTETNAVFVTDTYPSKLIVVVKDGTSVGALPISNIAADDSKEAFVKVTVEDALGNLIKKPGMTVRVSFGNSGRHILTDSVVPIGTTMTGSDEASGVYYFLTDSNGEIEFKFKGGRAGSYSITASCMNVTPTVSSSKQFATVAGTVMVRALVLKSDNTPAKPVNVAANTWYTFRVGIVDNGDNLIGATEAVTVALEQDGHGKYYSDRDTATLIAGPLAFAKGESYKTVYYRATSSATGLDLSEDATLID